MTEPDRGTQPIDAYNERLRARRAWMLHCDDELAVSSLFRVLVVRRSLLVRWLVRVIEWNRVAC